MLNYIVHPAQGVPAATFNADRTVHQGLEAGLDWRITPALRLRKTSTWSDFRFEADVQYADHHLPVVPPHRYRAERRYQHSEGWFLAPSMEWSADTWVDYANTLHAPGYAIGSLNAGWRGASGLEVFIEARNLTNARYVSNFSAVTNARAPGVSGAVFFPGDGRTVFGGLAWRY